jgi:hypothetical protein
LRLVRKGWERFEVSHPFAKNANGWGTQYLRLVRKGWEMFEVSHPFAK